MTIHKTLVESIRLPAPFCEARTRIHLAEAWLRALVAQREQIDDAIAEVRVEIHEATTNMTEVVQQWQPLR